MTVNLGPEVQPLRVFIPRDSDWTASLDIENEDGSPADLSGITARLHLPGGVEWDATLSGNRFTWSRTRAEVNAMTWQQGEASVTFNQGSAVVVWAKGEATRG